ncbi:carboxyltransferase domain-containing protein [Microbacterium oleivorans]|nr:carboxyltransferase domain-containing protein [Microbacterium oleivorans]
MGSAAVLVEVGGLDEAMALHARLAAAPPAGVVDIVPAAATVLVKIDRGMLSPERAREWIAAAAAEPAPAAGVAGELVLPVVYDGADLAEAARLLGMGPDALAARHAATAWTVAFTGFAPGFGYLVGADWDLDVPRRREPRTRVPAGAVGLAGRFSGAYPRETPGGWQLIGTTSAALFDPDTERPALLVPGVRVRFEPVRAATVVPAAPSPTGSPARPARPDAPVDPGPRRGPMRPGIRILTPGLLATVQDGGRPGRAAAGIASGGAADADAWALANRLLGNDGDAAAIEVVLGGLRAVAEGDLEVVVTGAWAMLSIDGWPRDPFVVHPWPSGSELRLDGFLGGARAYLAVRGGWDAAVVAGSRATDTLAGLGPAPLRAGDRLPVGEAVARAVPALPLHPWGLPPVGTDAAPLEIPFVRGPRDDWFTAGALTALGDAVWTVSADADRVGIRLDGPELERSRGGELPSEGMVPGAIQVPPAGRPVIFGVDGPVTGGYPVIGVVTGLGRSRLAQTRPGDRVRLRPVASPGRSV